jgi:hypothetical protein
MFQYEKSEGVIRSRKLQKDGQYNGKNKKRTNGQTTIYKTLSTI